MLFGVVFLSLLSCFDVSTSACEIVMQSANAFVSCEIIAVGTTLDKSPVDRHFCNTSLTQGIE